MEKMKGIFDLLEPIDLLKKLHYEFQLLKKEPDNAYIAFNFFVTAEHILDWLYPKGANKKKRKQERANSILLRICSHIANRKDPHHQSVSGTIHVGGYWPREYFPKEYFPAGYFPESNLIIRLDGEAKKQLGESITVIKLATMIIDFWDKHPDLKTRERS